MKKLYTLLALACLALLACNGDDEETIQQNCDTTAVLNPGVDAECYHINTDTFYLDTETTSYANYDIDADGQADIRLDVYFTNDKTTNKIIILNNELSCAVKTNQNGNNCLLKTFAVGDTINISPNWAACNEYMLMYYEDEHIPGFDPMSIYTTAPYLVFRKNVNGVYKYGWVNINYVVTPPSNFYSTIGIGPGYMQK